VPKIDALAVKYFTEALDASIPSEHAATGHSCATPPYPDTGLKQMAEDTWSRFSTVSSVLVL
jgi:hypothetical protein